MSFKWYGEEAKKQIFGIMEKGLLDMGADIVKQAKANANQPQGSSKHPQVQTGTLRRAITMDIVKERGKTIVKVGIMKGKGEGDKALEYAAPLELGTDRHPPYPYLFPAAKLITSKSKRYF